MQNLWIIALTVFFLTFISYLASSEENFTIDQPSAFGQGYYFGPHVPGPAWGYSPRDNGWANEQPCQSESN